MPAKLSLMFLVTLLPDAYCIAGSNILVTLRNGEQVKGELLAVKESTLIVSKDIGAIDNFLISHPEKILRVSRRDIQELTICGKSHLWDGIAIGLAGGICIGMLVSYQPTGAEAYNSNFDPQGGGPKMLALCAAAGIGLGALAGGTGTAVTNDRKINVESIKAWNSLRENARYDGDEPDYIKRATQ